ncbi:MAG: hypothetical protein DSM106950_43635 [Stigonema ocellatum SAG 48.90 = DSM 106950]|nr:hypothetical protein [Stigonema ocellatum SAG 48.90 = DSM 106950]
MYIKTNPYFFNTLTILSLIIQTTACGSNPNSSALKPPVTQQPIIPQTTPATPNVLFTPTYNELILGRWYGEPAFTEQDVTITLKGTKEYFPNKTYNTEGSLSISGIHEGKNITMNYNILMTGTWLITNQSLTETIVDVKSSIDSVSADGITYSSERIPEEVINSLPKLENFIAKGTSSSSRIISLTSSELKVEERGNDGNISSTTFYKH